MFGIFTRLWLRAHAQEAAHTTLDVGTSPEDLNAISTLDDLHPYPVLYVYDHPYMLAPRFAVGRITAIRRDGYFGPLVEITPLDPCKMIKWRSVHEVKAYVLDEAVIPELDGSTELLCTLFKRLGSNTQA